MLHRKIISVCFQVHTKHTNALCGQNVKFVNVKLVVHIVTTGLYRVKPLEHNSHYVFSASTNIRALDMNPR